MRIKLDFCSPDLHSKALRRKRNSSLNLTHKRNHDHTTAYFFCGTAFPGSTLLDLKDYAPLQISRPPPRLSGARLWIMRLSAMLLLPALTLAALEGALRLAGYGHTTRYWVKSEIDGTEYLVPNTTFTYLFFPPALARAPVRKD